MDCRWDVILSAEFRDPTIEIHSPRPHEVGITSEDEISVGLELEQKSKEIPATKGGQDLPLDKGFPIYIHPKSHCA
jgi:hypothetical protein